MMIHRRLLVLACASSLFACNTSDLEADFFDNGTYSVVFENAQITTTDGANNPVVEFADLDFTVNASTTYLSAEGSASYCYATGGTVLKTPYPYLCGYQGPAFLLVFEENQLYDGQIAGTLAGPSTQLELYGQYSPTFTDGDEPLTLKPLDVATTPSETPTPDEGTPTGDEATPDPTSGEETPTPGEESPIPTDGLSCTRQANHWTYGHILSRTELKIILRVADITTCKDIEGNTILAAGSRTDIEAEGILTLQ